MSFRRMDITVLFLWICSGESATLVFSPLTTNIGSITAAAQESTESSFNIIVLISPEEIRKTFEQNNVSFEEI